MAKYNQLTPLPFTLKDYC